MEKLSLGPDICSQENPQLIYGRMTGWGQTGPLAKSAGHDINYISLTGALHNIGTDSSGPVVPLNLLGDFGGGALYLAVGMLAAFIEVKNSGQGQVIDASIVDGTSHLMSMMYSLLGNNLWKDSRAQNLLDGSSPFYASYKCKDDKWISIGPIEEQFYQLFLHLLGQDLPECLFHRHKKANQEAIRHFLINRFNEKTQAEWIHLFEGTDVCFAPILSMHEAPKHPHNIARNTFVTKDGITQPAPSPRFSRTPTQLSRTPPTAGAHT